MGLVKPGNKVTSLIFSPLIYTYIYFSSWFPRPHSRLLYVFQRDHTLQFGDGPPFPTLFWFHVICTWCSAHISSLPAKGRLVTHLVGYGKNPQQCFLWDWDSSSKYYFLMRRFNEPFKNWDTRLWLVKLEPIILEQCLQSSFAPIKMAAH